MSTPTRPGLAFEIGCPDCAGTLNYITSDQPRSVSAAATLHCPVCERYIRVTVTIRTHTDLPRRVPAEPLIEWIVAHNQTDLANTGANSDIAYVANRLGVSPGVIHHLRHRGIDDRRADELATRLNVHPSQIWPNWWTESEESEGCHMTASTGRR